MRLTDRTFATGVTKQDLIHIVITGDTTDSPEGSSYKAPVGQILELYNLPVPNIQIRKGDGGDVYETLNSNNTVGPNIELVNTPYLTVNNLTEEQLNNNVWIEMVQYKIRKTRNSAENHRPVGGRYVIQPGIEEDGFGNPINKLVYRIKYHYGNDRVLTDRGGIMLFNGVTPLSVNRPNHTEMDITYFNKTVNLGYYLQGRFTYDTISYKPSGGGPMTDLSNVPVPTTNRRKNSLGQKTKSGNSGTSYQLCYTGGLTSLYIAFRYIMYDPYSNGGKGKIIEGPLSQTIKVTNKFFPFVKTLTDGECNANPAFDIGVTNQLIQCSFVNKP